MISGCYHGIPTFSAKISNKLIEPTTVHQILMHKKCFLDIEKRKNNQKTCEVMNKQGECANVYPLNKTTVENVINKVDMDTNNE